MLFRSALAGDTMLGRKVADETAARGSEALAADELVALAREADLFVLNLGFNHCLVPFGRP